MVHPLLPARIYRWMRRIRHRCGYGVHSPYAFQLITDVIYNNLPYYAYADLSRNLSYTPLLPGHYDPASRLSQKDLRLIFRLVNHQAPNHIAHYGAAPATLAHIRAARTQATISDLAQEPLPHDATFIYLDTIPQPTPSPINPQPSTINPQPLTINHTPFPLPPDAMIVIRGIHHDAAAQTLWQTLRDDPAITLTLDLWRFGIAIRRPKTTHENYLVNYF